MEKKIYALASELLKFYSGSGRCNWHDGGMGNMWKGLTHRIRVAVWVWWLNRQVDQLAARIVLRSS